MEKRNRGDDIKIRLDKDIAHMEKVFSFESDASDLISRFHAHLIAELN
jgi:hypothetical protein